MLACWQCLQCAVCVCDHYIDHFNRYPTDNHECLTGNDGLRPCQHLERLLKCPWPITRTRVKAYLTPCLLFSSYARDVTVELWPPA